MQRCDVTDVLHLLRRSADLDWERLLRRFGGHYRVLYAHLVLFGFVYPSERTAIPRDVLERLARRLVDEQHEADPRRVCLGTLLSRAQFLVDVTEWGFHDVRLDADVQMTREQIAHWTSAIPEEMRNNEHLDRNDKAGSAG